MRMYLKTRLFWNWSIRALLESYSIVTICAMINILDLNFKSVGPALSSTFAIIFLVTALLLPLKIYQVLDKNFHFLHMVEMKEKYGELYDSL